MISETGLCACGCERPTEIASCSSRRKGDIAGQPRRFLKGHARRRPMEYGKRLSTQGYILVYLPGHPRSTVEGYVFEHIAVAEAVIQRRLPRSVSIHHVNENKADNEPKNLVVLENHTEHMLLHRRLRVLRAGGNPWTQWLCSTCRTPKNFDRFYQGYQAQCGSVCRECSRSARAAAGAGVCPRCDQQQRDLQKHLRRKTSCVDHPELARTRTRTAA